MSNNKQKIELEDLWKISSSKIKISATLSLLLCLLAIPVIKSPNDFDNNNVMVLAKDPNGKNLGLQNLSALSNASNKPYVNKAIYIGSNGFCFSRPENDVGKIICAAPNTYGAINHISFYKIQNEKVTEAYSFYEPTTSAKFGISIIFWILFFATPIYFWAKKNADLSLIKEKTGKRKLFNFKKN